MCGNEGHSHSPTGMSRGATGVRVMSMNRMQTIAQHVVGSAEVRRSAAGFIGYGDTKRGDRVLLAVPRITDGEVIETVIGAMHDRGAKVDLMVLDDEPDRDFRPLDEIEMMMRREPYWVNLRRGDRAPWIEELAAARNYDLLIHGSAGPVPKSAGRYEAFPWTTKEHFLGEANLFPRELHRIINEHTWSRITENIGGRLSLTDPEGTDLTMSIQEKPFHDGRHDYGLNPKWGHLMAHPPTPVEPDDDTTGVIAGTMSHYGRAFPRIEIEVQRSKVVRISGGGQYGQGWRDLDEESANIQYPCFPAPGLFWLWELAIGTNPKIRRPSNIDRLSSDGFEWERRRGGVIHCGFGTRWRSAEEDWAGDQGLLYGHLHVHLLFPTLTVETADGRVIPVIEHGRLSAYDDPEVRDVAARYGDPDELLHDDWVPAIPGISTTGSLTEYQADPGRFIYPVASR
ncbi:MAG: hypothetical protein JWN95_259 [Frankiales bacterium]|nr:hypothetical protein [Frankiales bacterium]